MRLTQERTRRGWSRAELARRAGMNATTVGLIESGRFQPYPSQLEKLAAALDLPETDAALLLEEGPAAELPAPNGGRRGGAEQRP